MQIKMFSFRAAPVAALAIALFAGPANAAFHLMKVVEVFGGTQAAPNAQYVVIQMHSGGQNQVGGHGISVFGPTGNLIQTFSFTGPVAVGTNQSKILIASPAAATFFNLTADLSMPNGSIPIAGGKVCFDSSPVDCLAWGNYSGDLTGIGTPFNVATGLIPTKAATRRLNVFGSPTILEASDDTDNCATDFLASVPTPRNNAGAAGTIPANTCPNMVIEGLEECDDGNANNGDGCSSACLLEPNLYFRNGFENL
jgi:cysteine-rich repeat protein